MRGVLRSMRAVRGLCRGRLAALARTAAPRATAPRRMGGGSRGTVRRWVPMRGRFGGGDFAGAFHVPPPGGGGADHSGFGHMQAVPGRDLDSAGRQLVPAPNLRKRYAEAVSDRDQSVAPARGVVE